MLTVVGVAVTLVLDNPKQRLCIVLLVISLSRRSLERFECLLSKVSAPFYVDIDVTQGRLNTEISKVCCTPSRSVNMPTQSSATT